VIAHQGGWDEALLVAVPMIAVAGLLWLAKLRVNRAERAATERSAGSDPLDAGAHRGKAPD
jgi:hypothetical protein